MDEKTVIIIVGFLTTVWGGLFGWFMKRSDRKYEAAALEVKKRDEARALEVQRVADRLVQTDMANAAKMKANETKLQAIAIVADATHSLTNSNMSLALETIWKLFKRISEISGEDTDRVLAEEAQRKYEEHKKAQDKVDAKFPGGIPDAAEDIVEAVTSVEKSPAFSEEQSAELSRIIKESMNKK